MTNEEPKEGSLKDNPNMQKAIETVIPIVKKIESHPKMTKNNYAAYMAVLHESKDPNEMKLLAYALIQAGANKDGVVTALKLLL